MLARDSLVLDFMFQSGATLDPVVLLDALGGKDLVAERKILDPDVHGPQFEMQVSPSMPFRRRGERRLMVIDDSVAPLRADPEDFMVPLDLREEKERLISVCTAFPVRMGRINMLGAWGDAVLVAREARDLRAICLLPWALDPTIDIDGKQRARQLSQAEFENKIIAFEKRLDELDEKQMLANLGQARFERRGELLIVDVLEDDGTWDIRRSLALEQSLGAMDQFSLIPGAPKGGKAPPAAKPATPAPVAKPAPERDVAPLRAAVVAERVTLVFPPERFDRDIAAALGKGDVEAVLIRADGVTGQQRDLMHRDGFEFVAPIEFFSEVFLDGKPLARPQFDSGARDLGGARAMEVHCPRFGPVTLLDIPGKGRFITSNIKDPAAVLAVIDA